MRSLKRYDHSTDEACTYVRFSEEPDGEYTRYEDTMLTIEELAYAMDEIFNMKRELGRTYNLIGYHGANTRKLDDAVDLMKIAVKRVENHPTLKLMLTTFIQSCSNQKG